MNQENKYPLSVVLIARNEAENLARCLDSVAPWVNEIILVINDCTDSTMDIARGYNAHVHEHEWQGYRDQKNLTLDYATQPWILSLDADEEVSTNLKASIISFIKNDSSTFNGAYFPRKVWFMERWITHGDWYPDYSLRLFRAGNARWGGGSEHEKIVLDGVAQKISGDLHHYTYPSLNAQIEKIIYFSDIFLKRQLEAGKRWSVIQTVMRPWWRFMRGYFIKCGFMDGFPGFYIAASMAFYTLVRYSKLYEHNKSLNDSSDPG